jgi:hypothetical protein
VIYAWTGGDYVNLGAQLKEFYQQKLSFLLAQIPRLPSSGPGSNPGDQRFIGISRDSGLNQAIELAKDSDSAKRIFAADILADIGTPAARKYVETLTKDSDHMVAVLAGKSLFSISHSPYTSAEKFEPLQ